MDDFSYAPARFSMPRGKIVLRLVNKGTIEHNVVLRGIASRTVHVGKTYAMRLMLGRPGTYYFYCSVPGHYDQGMKGAIRVR